MYYVDGNTVQAAVIDNNQHLKSSIKNQAFSRGVV